MPETTTTTPSAPKKTHQSCLTAETQKYLKTVREELGKARLGSVGRRLQMAGEMLQEGITQFGTSPMVLKLGDAKVTVPVEVTATIKLDVKVGNATQSYTFAVGAHGAPAQRTETPLTTFVNGTATVGTPTETLVVRQG